MSKQYLTERERSARKVNYHLLYSVDLTPKGYPVIHRQQIPKHVKRLIGFNEVLRHKNPIATGVHFFVDDYQFERLWEHPERYIERLRQFAVVCAPDFSLYGAYPEPLQQYNHYRNQLLGAWMQAQGCTVVAAPSWSDEASFPWCFDGQERGAPVAISTVGVGHRANTAGFMRGIAELWEQKAPEQAIIYGKMLTELQHWLKKRGIAYTHYLGGQAMRTQASKERRNGEEPGEKNQRGAEQDGSPRGTSAATSPAERAADGQGHEDDAGGHTGFPAAPAGTDGRQQPTGDK